MQHNDAEDFVIATGTTTSVRDFIKMAFAEVGVKIAFKGKGEAETGYVEECSSEYGFKKGQELVKIDPAYFRPTEVDLLMGDPSKAKQKLNWQPKYTLAEMIKEMVAADIESFKKEKTLIDSGYAVSRKKE
jgi:GDPmannose 4,6-dehydratase